jgi:hypothetical protein
MQRKKSKNFITDLETKVLKMSQNFVLMTRYFSALLESVHFCSAATPLSIVSTTASGVVLSWSTFLNAQLDLTAHKIF